MRFSFSQEVVKINQFQDWSGTLMNDMQSVSARRKKVGLALSGGAARGFAHLGVLKVLVERGIPIDYIAGTSAGSFAGAAFAAGMSVEEITDMSREVSWASLSGLTASPRSLLTNAPMGKLIGKRFPAHRIEDLKIPFAAVACDLDAGKEYVFRDEGDLATAVRASCAIPGVYAPIKHDGKFLVDGGIITAMPSETVKQLGADIVIAVDVLASGSSYFSRPRTLLGVMLQSALTLIKAASEAQHYHADVVIIPEVAHLRPDQMGKLDEFIELGAKATLAKIDEIERLIGE